MAKKAFEKIMSGLRDALAHAKHHGGCTWCSGRGIIMVSDTRAVDCPMCLQRKPL